MNFDNEPIEWGNNGSEIPSSLKESGWSANQKPPANYFNKKWSNDYNVQKELQDKLNGMAVTRGYATVGYSEYADYVVVGDTEREKAESFKAQMDKAIAENYAVCILQGIYYLRGEVIDITASRRIFGESLFTEIKRLGENSNEAVAFELKASGIELSGFSITSEDETVNSPESFVVIRGDVCRLDGLNFIDHRNLGEDTATEAVRVNNGIMTIVNNCRFNLEHIKMDVWAKYKCLVIGCVNTVREFNVGGAAESFGCLGTTTDELSAITSEE
jgi:hypothetical protein